MSQNVLPIALALLVGSYFLLSKSKKEGFAQALSTDGPSSVNIPSLPSQGVAGNPGNYPSTPSYRSDVNGLQQGGLRGSAEGDMSAAGSQFVNSGSPIDFKTVGNYQQNTLLKNNLLSSKQVTQALNDKFRATPELQSAKDLMPIPDMKYSASVDPTNPENFIYDRTLFSRLKRRYGNGVDFIRGDVDVRPEYRGWFDIRPPSDVDLVQGYFDKYIDIEQETRLQDSVFTRNSPVSKVIEGEVSPWGRADRLPGVYQQ